MGRRLTRTVARGRDHGAEVDRQRPGDPPLAPAVSLVTDATRQDGAGSHASVAEAATVTDTSLPFAGQIVAGEGTSGSMEGGVESPHGQTSSPSRTPSPSSSARST